jgi:hypothetical protein
MTKCTFSIALLSSIVVLNIANLANSQAPSNDLFGDAGAESSPSLGGDGLQAPGGSTRNKNQGSGREFTLDGALLTASRVRSFTVNVSTLQIQQNGMGAMGGMDGGYGSEGGDAMGGYGGMGGMTGGMAGMEEGAGGGMASGMGDMGMGGMGMGGMGMGGMGMGGMADIRVVVAFIMDDEKAAGRTRIEVLAQQGKNYVRLESLTGPRPSKAKADKKAPPLWSPAAAKLIKDTICLKIWKEDAIKTLKNEEGRGEQAAASEKLLKEVLSEEYDTQLERQHFELVRLQERLKRIQDEFTRRKQAKDRVIDVQLGKIILEAQGILGDQ